MSNPMTLERAIEIIKDELPYESSVINEALTIIEKAIGYRTPKKRIEKPTKAFFVDIRCPNCKTLIGKTQKYCIECGQALDRRDEE